MDAELKNYLDQMKAELRSNSDALESRLRAQTEELEVRLHTRSEELETRLRAHTEVVETRLLTEFWKWAKTADARYRQNQGVVNGLDIRVMAIEDRVADLERRP